jgi:hypothetical protein
MKRTEIRDIKGQTTETGARYEHTKIPPVPGPSQEEQCYNQEKTNRSSGGISEKCASNASFMGP